jgi:hypothetical protein
MKRPLDLAALFQRLVRVCTSGILSLRRTGRLETQACSDWWGKRGSNTKIQVTPLALLFNQGRLVEGERCWQATD